MAAETDRLLRAAMMEELGSGRLDTLPMDDRLHRHYHGRDLHAQGKFGQRTATHTRPRGPTTPIGHGDHGAPSAMSNLAKLWKVAIEDGHFNDGDADDIKGLDSLGGGRSYAHAARLEESWVATPVSAGTHFRPNGRSRGPARSKSELRPDQALGRILGAKHSSRGLQHSGSDPIAGIRAHRAPPTPESSTRTRGQVRAMADTSKAVEAHNAAPPTGQRPNIRNGAAIPDAYPDIPSDPSEVRFSTDVLVQEGYPTRHIPAKVWVERRRSSPRSTFVLRIGDDRCYQWDVIAWRDTVHCADTVCIEFTTGTGEIRSHGLQFEDKTAMRALYRLLPELKRADLANASAELMCVSPSKQGSHIDSQPAAVDPTPAPSEIDLKSPTSQVPEQRAVAFAKVRPSDKPAMEECKAMIERLARSPEHLQLVMQAVADIVSGLPSTILPDQSSDEAVTAARCLVARAFLEQAHASTRLSDSTQQDLIQEFVVRIFPFAGERRRYSAEDLLRLRATAKKPEVPSENFPLVAKRSFPTIVHEPEPPLAASTSPSGKTANRGNIPDASRPDETGADKTIVEQNSRPDRKAGTATKHSTGLRGSRWASQAPEQHPTTSAFWDMQTLAAKAPAVSD